MQLSKKQQQELSSVKAQRRKPLLIVVGIVVGLFVITEVADVTGQVRFYTTWATCGQRPMVADPGIEIGGGSVGDYAPAPIFSVLRPFESYHCTPLEAEKAGLSANPEIYEFPHLEAERAKGDLE